MISTVNEMEIFTSADNQVEVFVRVEGETFWLSQRSMSELFGKDTDTIGEHIKNIYEESELDERSTTELFTVVQMEGKRK